MLIAILAAVYLTIGAFLSWLVLSECWILATPRERWTIFGLLVVAWPYYLVKAVIGG